MPATPAVPDPRVIQESAARGDIWFPYAYVKPLPEATTQARLVPTQFIMHTQASGSAKVPNKNSWAWWNRTDVKAEAHFLLSMSPDTEPEGAIWQVIPINVRADNNVKSNDRAVSIETQDNGGATVDVTPWTDFQVTWLGALLAWLNLRGNVPLQMVGPLWSDPGYAPHNLFPNDWSTSAHSCPGKARTKQIGDVVRVAQQIIDWRPYTPPVETPSNNNPVPQEDDDMTPFLITNGSAVAVVYGTGKVTGLPGTALATAKAKWGEPLQLGDAEFQDFANKGRA